MLKKSLAVTTTQLVKDGNVMDITVIFNAGDLVTNGVFFPSKRMGHAVFNTLIDKGDVELDVESLLTRRSHFSHEGILEFFNSILEKPQQVVIKSFTNSSGVEYQLAKLYYLKDGAVREGYCVNDSETGELSAKFFFFKRDAHTYFSSVCEGSAT